MLLKRRPYSDGWIDYPGKGRIYDKDIALFVKKHLRFRDRFDVQKISDATLLATGMLMGVVDIPKEKNWKF